MKRNFLLSLFLTLSLVALSQGKRVLFIGDSVTDGAWGNSKVWNTPSEQRNQRDLNHIYGHGYMMIVASSVQARFPGQQWTFWNRGISGNTLADLAARWEKDVLMLRPDVVSILIGTNDVDRALKKGLALDMAEWGTRYRHLLDSVRQINPGIQFVLCTPFVAHAGKLLSTSDYQQRVKMITDLCDTIRKICKEYQATLVPFDELVRDTISAYPSVEPSYWIWDGIHPTPAMHYLMAEMWMKNFFNS